MKPAGTCLCTANEAAKPVALMLCRSASLGLKVPVAVSWVAAKHVDNSFHCCDPAPHCFISKRSCCSKRGRIQQGEQ